ncbi:polysaccharide biosynthesis protein [Rathayibacter soli]|uniref:polysaccharide biosynthesis protein n=1 Tax=Rathayibacter soli TaxID=3144168 RepID=UPI0027E5B85E|nr:nucleoside-diphosphate sugar epimerase/dehydratase [Glaciibacter superstes]
MALSSRLWSAAVRKQTADRGETLIGRFGSQYLLDAVAWAVALIGAEICRYEFDVNAIHWLPLIAVVLATAVAQLLIGWGMWLYRGRYTFGSFHEVRALAYTALLVGFVVGLPVILYGVNWSIPRSTIVIALPFALVLMAAARYVKRLMVERQEKPGEGAQPTLIYGAGYMGGVLARRMVTDRLSAYRPVGFIDDDKRRRNLQLSGISVLGTGKHLTQIVAKTGARTLIIAIARADATLLRTITDAALAAGLTVKVLPVLDEILAGKSGLSDVRDISIEDLIGRHPVDTDVSSIAGYVTGKRVLVTGAGGSIGSELCRQLFKYGPAELIMLDRDETGLQRTELSIFGHGLLNTKDVVLADIRDPQALAEIFTKRRPQVVFHTAALKHLPMLEQYPDEAWKTNVLGTLNVLEAARDAEVSTFVNISTDKAANPTSVLGHSKRVGEKLTAWMAEETDMRYLSVRFGNVIGSRGSMLPTFKSLIEAGGPVTVTHPDVTRFFMTIPEACQLVVQAGGIGDPGEVLILDMGEPVRILDIAQRMIAASGKPIEIVYTGLREGEKLNEELMGFDEVDNRPKHPKISHAKIPPMPASHLDKEGWDYRLRTNGGDTAIIQRLSVTKAKS